MKSQSILMFCLLMVFSFAIETAIAQTPTTVTRTEVQTETDSGKKEGWFKRRKNRKAKKKMAASKGKKPAKKDMKVKKSTKKVGTPKVKKPAKTGGVKPAKNEVNVVKPGKTKYVKKPTKPKKAIGVEKQVAKSNKAATERANPKKAAGLSKGKKVKANKQGAKHTGKGKVKVKGAPQCNVKGCEHPGKHLGLHKHQNPIRPYKKTAQGYQEVDEDGNVIPRSKKVMKKRIQKSNH